MAIALSFASAWSMRAESDLPLDDYSRRRTLLRRQKIVHISNQLGWQFLRCGQPISTPASVLAGISLTKRGDYDFLDLLRAHEEIWNGFQVAVFNAAEPHVLRFPRPILETPVLAVFQDSRLTQFHQGEAALQYIVAPK